jgi:DNA-directed RNA polymerase subunit RPC12/RpoP
MISIVCQKCGKQGTLEEDSYLGKRLRLRCPYCSGEFVFAVPKDGQGGQPEPAEIHAEAPQTSLAAEEEAPPEVHDEQPVVEAAPPPPARSEQDESLIHEAKRIARLIISEIKLYNQEKIAKAKTRKEVLDLLRNDLIKGKQHYNVRIASKLPAGPDYFMESVKEILLGGKQ